MSLARIGRFGLAGIGALWLFSVVMTFVTDIDGTGKGRAAIPLFRHPQATGTTFAILAAVLVLATLTVSDRWLMRVALLWFVAQLAHLSYHLYDIGIMLPEDRFRLISGFVVIIFASAYFTWLLHRGAAEAHTSADADPRHPELSGSIEHE